VTQLQRIDRALVVAGLARDTSEALQLIAQDRVTVNGAPVLNVARQVHPRDQVAVVEVAQFVSRGGLKLDAALNHFAQAGDAVAIAGARVLDAGASTGGFVDCLLQRGAGQVVACDVGRGLLHPKIAADGRVEVRDELNARDIGASIRAGALVGDFDLVVADLSFISLTLVAESLVAATRTAGQLLVLVKPQFEASKPEVDKGAGVIIDDAIRQRCIAEVREAFVRYGVRPRGEVESAVAGPAGNREHWLRLTRE
jgi:23S rRNA (cytidine1920-2'-O)/16S rRNA (cytidine1409-2'-O)-methyltransferase